MGQLFFENSYGERREIANNITKENCTTEIKKFIDKHNKGKPKDKKFKTYYIRTWEESGETVYDVGSYTEFFYFRN